MSPALQSQLTATLDSLDSAFLEPNPSNFKTLTHVIAVLARGAGARDTTSFSEEALNDNPHFVSLLSSYAAVQDCITAITTSQYSSLNSSVVTVGNLGRSLNLSLTQVRQMRAAIAATKTTLQVSTEQEDGDAEAAVIDSHRLSDLYQTKQQCEAVLQVREESEGGSGVQRRERCAKASRRATHKARTSRGLPTAFCRRSERVCAALCPHGMCMAH